MYKAITPATDWFFVHEGQAEPIVWPLAVWALKHNDETIGLIGAFGRDHGLANKTPHLSAIPAVPGRYLHRSQLTQEELRLAGKRASLDTAPVA